MGGCGKQLRALAAGQAAHLLPSLRLAPPRGAAAANVQSGLRQVRAGCAAWLSASILLLLRATRCECHASGRILLEVLIVGWEAAMIRLTWEAVALAVCMLSCLTS